MEKQQIAEILDEMGTLLELRGENPFRVRAYRNASLVISTSTADLSALAAAGTLTTIKGVGKGLAVLITELLNAGTSKELEDLRKSVPPGLREMLRIQGLGPKRIKILYDKLGLKTVAALRKACTDHALRSLDGFGEKTEENILRGIALLESTSSKHLCSVARTSADAIVASLRKAPGVIRCDVAGSLRRRKELIGDIDIIASVPEERRGPVMDLFGSHPTVASVSSRGDTKSTVMLMNGIPCDLRLVEDDEFPFALNYFTGSKEHNVEMRSRALRKGWSLNEYRFSKSEKGGKAVPSCHDEEEIYKALGLAYVPPELRENLGEFEAAAENRIPALVQDSDIHGVFHCHTDESDGINTLQEMVAAARELGWNFLGIADHSRSAAYAGGLTPQRLKSQVKTIGRMNESLKVFRIFAGTECDILADGDLDYPDSLLSILDYVVVSVHSRFKMTEAEATKRICKALRNPYATMLGHPTGRLLLEREGYPVDMQEVLRVAAGEGKSVEVNAHPMRLDTDWRHLRFAKELGVKIFVNPDAHSTAGLRDTFYGVGIARKGWLEPADVVNTFSVERVEKFLKDGRRSK